MKTNRASNTQPNQYKMYKFFWGALLTMFFAQNSYARLAGPVDGDIKDAKHKGLYTASFVFLHASDSTVAAADYADTSGHFDITVADTGTYIITCTMLGYKPYRSTPVRLEKGKQMHLPEIVLDEDSAQLNEVTLRASKPLIEVKADRVVFNVEGSINATGSNALELLRKSPGGVVDNNENLSLRGKAGVKIYIDGKPSPLDGKDLATYLKSINSSDIEAIEMISNPGAQYDASGSAGIINIRLRKSKKPGTNGSVSFTQIQGNTPKENGSVSLNYRDGKMNLFGNLSGNVGRHDNGLVFNRTQLDTVYKQSSNNYVNGRGLNLKAGADFFLNSRNTIGALFTANVGDDEWVNHSGTEIYYHDILLRRLDAYNRTPGCRTNNNINLNYKFEDTLGHRLNIDADNGLFRGRSTGFQPNYYTDPSGNPLYSVINQNNQPTDIYINTLKADWEQKFGHGKLSAGVKFSNVETYNTFNFYDVATDEPLIVPGRSNSFRYSENVNAAYLSYADQITTKVNLQAGVRVENTNSRGALTRLDGQSQSDDTVVRHYTNFFPNLAVSWTANPKHSFNITAGRRIDRPSYQDLNPFENKLDELTYQKGNAFLRPMYTNIVELTHTYKERLNTTISYSEVQDFATQISDTLDNATYVQQRNIGTQRIFSLNMGAPLNIKKWWSCYLAATYLYSQYDGNINTTALHVTLPSYNFYMQHTFNPGKDYSIEVSGMYNGPSVWGGSWTVKPLDGADLGIQKQLLDHKATLKISITDMFYTYPWYAHSDFGGLKVDANGNYESRTARISFTYRFGNSSVKAARTRNTGLESESNRIKSK